jgi:PTS system glucose-specific IIA component
MGFFDKLFKKKEEINLPAVNVSDDAIVAVADGQLIDVTTVSDPVFAEKMMGDGIAFRFPEEKVTLCSPVNGTLSVLFPTGHAFGVTMANGVEVLVHIGIETVNAKGDGFTLHKKRQGDTVRAGDPIVTADFAKLAKTYDTSTMLIITDPKDQAITFKEPGPVKKGDSVIL